ncbi:MAG: IS5 family transposase [Lachnospiraceae bacterium]|nr:IS5 family transposase [Lachnospiraceae bacterium]
MQQQTFTDVEYSRRKVKTRREEFLDTMDRMIPWADWIEIIRPYYPSGKRGRPTRGIETMLRMYLLQNWFNLSDVGIEEAIYDSYAMRSFMRIDFTSEQVPDSTTLLKFRHLLEKHHIGEKLFADVNDRLDKAGLMMHGGSIVDATIISAPSSTKNKDGERDPEMHQTKKGNQWYHGMKIHAGVDAGTGYTHTITATAANVHDIDEAAKLIREDDTVVYGDSGYSGLAKRPEMKGDKHLSKVECRTSMRPGKRKNAEKQGGFNCTDLIEHRKSSIRSKVEHPFLIVKRQFGYAKVAYRGLAKNFNRFNVLFASANMIMCARAGRMAEFCGV